MHPDYRYRATVASIYDGDTFRADIDLGFSAWLKNVNFRMMGIDTPELRGDAAEKEAGRVARDRLHELMPVGSPVLIQSTKAGKYGRYLADVFVEQAEGITIHVNAVLVAEGHAVPYFGGTR